MDLANEKLEIVAWNNNHQDLAIVCHLRWSLCRINTNTEILLRLDIDVYAFQCTPSVSVWISNRPMV